MPAGPPGWALAAALALAGAVRAEGPKVQAAEILNACLSFLGAVPSGQVYSRFLWERKTVLSISRDAVPAPALSRLDLPGNAVVFGAGHLDGVYSELEAQGVLHPPEIAHHIGIKLVPSLAHEACHAILAGMLRAETGADVPATLEEEAVCLYEELLLWRDLRAIVRGPFLRGRTDLDRLGERVAWLVGRPRDPAALLREVGLHYPDLPSLDAPRSRRKPSPGPLELRRDRALAAMDRLKERLSAGGPGSAGLREAIGKLEELASRSVPIGSVHLFRPGGQGKALSDPSVRAKARGFLRTRLVWLQEKLADPSWTAWREREFPDWTLASATTDEEKLRWSVASARLAARVPPDLLREGNAFHLKKVRRLARALGRDIRAADREASLTVTSKIHRLLANAERLAAQGDPASRRWAYLSVRRTETESRETWDMTPPWVVGRQRGVLEALRRATAKE